MLITICELDLAAFENLAFEKALRYCLRYLALQVLLKLEVDHQNFISFALSFILNSFQLMMYF